MREGGGLTNRERITYAGECSDCSSIHYNSVQPANTPCSDTKNLNNQDWLRRKQNQKHTPGQYVRMGEGMEWRAGKFKNNEQHIEGKGYRPKIPPRKINASTVKQQKRTELKTLGCLTVSLYLLKKNAIMSKAE
jgi:hypothetical protein